MCDNTSFGKANKETQERKGILNKKKRQRIYNNFVVKADNRSIEW